MPTTIGTGVFYIAPSKEHHPLVSKLLRMEYQYYKDGHEKTTQRVVSVRRTDGFLTGTFGIIDGDVRDETFMKLYEELGDLGYISEDYRSCWWEWSSDGCTFSTWYDRAGDTAYEIGTKQVRDFSEFLLGGDELDDIPQLSHKEKVRKFWEEFPNLMHILKYDRPPDEQPPT